MKPSENRLIQDEDRHTKIHRSNRRRWCKGKEGVEHELVCMTFEEAKGPPRYPSQAAERFLVCKACGKELEKFWGLPCQQNNKPAWVTR